MVKRCNRPACVVVVFWGKKNKNINRNKAPSPTETHQPPRYTHVEPVSPVVPVGEIHSGRPPQAVIEPTPPPPPPTCVIVFLETLVVVVVGCLRSSPFRPPARRPACPFIS